MIIFEDHIGKEGGQEGHLTLGEINHFGCFVDDDHSEPHEGIGTTHHDPTYQHLKKIQHGANLKRLGFQALD